MDARAALTAHFWRELAQKDTCFLGLNTAKQQIDAIFFTALNLPDDGQRKAFLDRACAGDSTLRVTVEKMLSAHSATEEFFAQSSNLVLSTEDLQAAVGESVIEQCASFDGSIGARIGRYRVSQRLGEGGWGVVYMAEQEKPIRRHVALKIIKLGLETRSVIDRFQSECQALAMMDHPGIARVLDAGATENGRPYFVMELVNGTRINEFCDSNKLGMPERLGLFIKICQAVQHAHQKGIIHRDLKPANILVAMHDGVPSPKVIDFGIATAIEDRLAETAASLPREQTVGTPAYMSPEQTGFGAQDVDTRTDIYSLGVVLYELLAGLTPPSPMKQGALRPEEIQRGWQDFQPQRPSRLLASLPASELNTIAASRNIEPGRLLSILKGDLDCIVLKLLEKDRNNRYATANAAATDLQRYLNNEPVAASRPNGFYRFQKLLCRNKTVFAASAVLLLALVASLGMSLRLLALERNAWREQAHLRSEAQSAQAGEARLRHEAEVREKLTRVAGFVAQNNFNEADELFAQIPLDEIEPAVESMNMLRNLGQFYACAGRWRQAADCFAKLMQSSRVITTDEATTSMDLLYAESAALECGDLHAYEQFRQDTLERLAKPKYLTTIERVIKGCTLAAADESTCQRLKPLTKILQNSMAATAKSDRDAENWQLLALAMYDYREGDFTNALACAQEGLKSPDPNQSRVAALQSVVAMTCYRLGQTGLAMSDLDQARKLVEAKFTQPLQQGYFQDGSWGAWVIARHLQIEAATLLQEVANPDGTDPVSNQE